MSTEVIWEEFSDRILEFIKRRINDPIDAEDILQDIFIKIHKGLHNLETSEKLLPWVFAISRNTIIDYYRKKRPQHLEVEHVIELSEGQKEKPMDLHACLLVFVKRLPARYKQVMELRFALSQFA